MTEPNAHMIPRPMRMQQIRITLWHDDEMRDWSIEIDGQRHDHISSDLVEALVEHKLIVAETSLTNQQWGNPQTPITQ